MSRKVLLSKLKPIRNNIIVTDMNFDEVKTKSGIVILSDDGKSEGVRHRWGKVHAVGPEQKDVKAGEWILLEHGRWSRGFTVLDDDGNDIVIRRGDPNAILIVTDEKPEENMLNTHGSHSKVSHATFDPSTFARPSFEQ
jgi:co-chaperonin GroES (HSP10)